MPAVHRVELNRRASTTRGDPMRKIVYVVVVLLLSGCVPIGVRWQNMMAEHRTAASA